MVIYRVRLLHYPGVRAEAADVCGDSVAHRNQQVAFLEEAACEGLVEELWLVGDGVVNHRGHFHAVAAKDLRYRGERDCKIGHPVAEYDDVGLLLQYPAGAAPPCQGICRIKDAHGVDRHSLVFRRDVLRLAGKEKIGVLPREVEGGHFMILPQRLV